MHIHSYKVNMKSLVNSEAMLTLNMGCFSSSLRQKMQQMRQDVTSTGSQSDKTISRSKKAPITSANAKKKDDTRASLNKSNLEPVSYNPPTIASASGASSLLTLSSECAHVKHLGQATMHCDDGDLLTLQDGEALILSRKPMTIKANGHNLMLHKGTVAVVSRKGDVLKVQNIHERKGNSIKIQIGKRYVSVPASKEILIGKEHSSLLQSLKDDRVGRRHINNFDISDDYTITQAEISLVSLIQESDLLSKLIKSDHRKDRAVADNILKMAACLKQVTSHRGAPSPGWATKREQNYLDHTPEAATSFAS